MFLARRLGMNLTGRTGTVGRWLVTAGLIFAGLGGLGGALSTAWAQTRIKPEATPTPPPSSGLRKHIQQVRDQPSEESKSAPLDDPGTRITPAPEVAAGQERNLPPPEPNVDRPRTMPELTGKAKSRLFRTPAYKQRLGELQSCRNEVAFDRKVKPSTVVARGVLLRWTVNREGKPQDVEVVAVAPTDPDVMTCVHRKLSAWQEAELPDDPYRVSHKLSFR
jgi:hypothetical protein